VPEATSEPNVARAVDALKRHMILRALRDTGNKTRAAERLGVPRQSLQKMIKRLEISKEEIDGTDDA
jgi:transcriptional regulator with PAS, ATPase and Fis domain